MADVNALIAQGGNILGSFEQAARIRNTQTRNELLQLGIENEPARQARLQAQEERLTAQGTRLQAAEDRAQSGFDTIEGLRQGISLMRFLDKDDVQGAIDFVAQDGITEKEKRVIDMLQSGDPAQIEALKTGTKGLIETALLVGDIKGQAAAPETFRAATQDELAGRPEGTAAQISETTGKLTNIFTPDSVGGKASFTEDANGRKRYDSGPNKGELLFPDLTVTPDKSKNAETEEGLRKEFNTLVKDFNLVSDSFARVKASVEDPTGAGDLALIFNFMKMLDPNSVVRESEFATAQNTGNVENRIIGLYNRLLSEEGKRLSVQQRNDFTNRANKLFDAAKGQATKTAEAYSLIAENNNVDVGNVIANFTVRAEQGPVPELAEGTVIQLSNGQFQKVVNGVLVNFDG